MALNNGCTCVLFSLAFCSFVLSIIVKTVYTHTHIHAAINQTVKPNVKRNRPEKFTFAK